MLIEVIGWTGSGLVLIAYLFVSNGKLSARSNAYQIINFLGALFLINSGFHQALPSVGLNVVWLIIAIYGIIQANRKRKTSKK